jgi:hypothetical protein
VGARWGKGKREASSTPGRLGLVSGWPEVARRRGAGLAAGGGLRRRRSGGPGRRRAGLGASRRHEEAILGVDLGRGGEQVWELHGAIELERRAATPLWPRDGSARLGEGRRVESEANGEGESSAGGGVVVERTRRVRVAVACSPRGSNGRVKGSSEEGWGAAAVTGRGELRAHHGRS